MRGSIPLHFQASQYDHEVLHGGAVQGNGLTLANDIRVKGTLPAALNCTCAEQREPAVPGFIHQNSLSELCNPIPLIEGFNCLEQNQSDSTKK